MSGFGGIRGGVRGGRDQFEWEDVKADKDRENYLGHSVMAPVGRWQKGKDLTWYTKKSKVTSKTENLKAEVASLKKAEEEAMAAALGLKSSTSAQPQHSLTKQQIAEACRRRSTDELEGGVDAVKGVGYQSRRSQMLYSGAETTTKAGMTVFEHDPSLRKDDGRLKMVAGEPTGRPSKEKRSKHRRHKDKKKHRHSRETSDSDESDRRKRKHTARDSHSDESDRRKRKHTARDSHKAKRRRHDTSSESD